VYVFVKPAGGWTDAHETSKLTASAGAENELFGFAVGAGGATVVAGAPAVFTGNPGSAYAFVFLSANADLSGLAIGTGTLSPAFAAGTISYTDSVGFGTSSVTVTPTVAESHATVQVRVNGASFAAVASGSPSGPLALNVGANTVDVKVTAQ